MRAAWALLCAACTTSAATGAATGEEHAITSGTVDDGDLAAVALVSGTQVLCSGALIAPRVVLTAAHCVDADARPDVFFGSAPSLGGDTVSTIDVRMHPDFVAATLANDLALLLLAAPAPAGATPWPLATMLLGAADVGRPVRLIGFGLTSVADSAPNRKHQGTTTIGSVTAAAFDFGPDPSQTCLGDSGGPALLDDGGGEVLAGIHSSGDPGCVTVGVATRVDPFVTAWIQPYVDATAEGARGLGERCWYDENCVNGSCVVAPDEPRLRTCTQPCATDVDCPAPLVCAADGLCRHLLPTPGALGSSCLSVDDCVTARCASSSDGEPTTCTTTCFLDLPGTCPASYACLPVIDQPGQPGASACFAGDGGESGCGCAVGRAPRDSPASWLLLLALALPPLIRRRSGRRTRTRIRGRSCTSCRSRCQSRAARRSPARGRRCSAVPSPSS